MNNMLKNILIGAAAVTAIGGVAYAEVKHNEELDRCVNMLKDDHDYAMVVRFFNKARQAEGAKRSLYAQEALEELNMIRRDNSYANTLKLQLKRWATEEKEEAPASRARQVSNESSVALATLQMSRERFDRRLAEAVETANAEDVRHFALLCKDKANAQIVLAAYNRGEFRA